MNVYEKLSSARAKFHCIELKKSGHNKFAGYRYFELSDFIIPALNVFREAGLLGVVSFGNDTAELRIVDLDDVNSCIVINSPMSTAALKGCHEVQNLGAVQTYIRRYLWVAALEIVEHDALDSSKPLDESVKKPSGITPTSGAFDELDADMKDIVLETASNIESVYQSDISAAQQLYLDATAGDDEQLKVALWSKLSSGCRAAIKKYKGAKA